MIAFTAITFIARKWLPIVLLSSVATGTETPNSKHLTFDGTRSDPLATILDIFDAVVSTKEARKRSTLDKLFGNFREKTVHSNTESDHAEEIFVGINPVKKSEYTNVEPPAVRLPHRNSDRRIEQEVPFVLPTSGLAHESALPLGRIVKESTDKACEMEGPKSPMEKLQISGQKFPNLQRETEERIDRSNPIDLKSILGYNENLKFGEMYSDSKYHSRERLQASLLNASPEADEIEAPVGETTWRKPGPATRSCFPDLDIPEEVAEVMRDSARLCVKQADQKLGVFKETLPCSELRQLLLDSLADDSTEKADLRDAGKRRPPRHSTYWNPLPEVEVFDSAAYAALTQRPVAQRNEDAEIVRVSDAEEKLSALGTAGSLSSLLPSSAPSNGAVKGSLKVLFQYLLEGKFRQLLTTCLLSSLNLLTLDASLDVVSLKTLVSKVFNPSSSPDVPLLHSMVHRCSGGTPVVAYRQVQAVLECVQAKIDVLCMARLQLSPDEVYFQRAEALGP